MLTPLLTIEDRKQLIKTLSLDNHFTDLLFCYIRLDKDINYLIRQEEKIQNVQELMCELSTRDLTKLFQQRLSFIYQHQEYIKNLILRKCGIKKDLFEPLRDDSVTNLIFTKNMELLMDYSDVDKRYINPYIIEVFLYSIVNLDQISFDIS